MKDYFRGTTTFTKLLFRKNRLKLFIWIASFFLVSVTTAMSYPDVFLTQEDLYNFGMTVSSPAMIALLGPAYSLEDYNYGSIFASEMFLFTAVVVAVMNILLASRATRRDEEDGILELVRSLPVGKLTYPLATLILLVVTNLLLTVSMGLGLGALNIKEITWEGAFLYGALLSSTGLLFGAITILVAQLASTSRGTVIISFGVLIVSYFLRAIGDVKVEWLSYLSPLGWMGRAYVFVENNWWPVLLSLVFILIFFGVAFYLNTIRDIDAGFLPIIPGRAHASAVLKTPIGLTIRLQWVLISFYGVTIFLFGLAMGAILGDFETYFKDLPVFQELLQSGEASLYSIIAFLNKLFAFINVIPAMIVMFHLTSEERNHRTEMVYSTPLSRVKLFGVHYLVAIFVSILMQVLIGLSLWITGHSSLDGGISIQKFLSASTAYLPAMWVMIGLTTIFIGRLPKGNSIAWMYLAFCFVVDYIGEIVGIHKIIKGLSVFDHVPFLPEDKFSVFPLFLLTLIAMIFVGIGLNGYKRRDLMG